MPGTDDDKTGASRSADDDERARKAQEAFERGLIERGEAAKADEHGQLPPKATHEIVGYDASGRPILKRRRFSAI
jgi:hypothetical protein